MGGLVNGWVQAFFKVGGLGRDCLLMGVGMKTYITSLRLGEVASSLQVLTNQPPAG